ncbi:MAG TPA: helix-turn-helix domain-containing protein [Jiangellaceae bacterium]
MHHQGSSETAIAAGSERGPYRVSQLAAMLAVHPTTVYRAIESGRLAALRIGAGRGGLRITHAAYEAFLDSISTVVTTEEEGR